MRLQLKLLFGLDPGVLDDLRPLFGFGRDMRAEFSRRAADRVRRLRR